VSPWLSYFRSVALYRFLDANFNIMEHSEALNDSFKWLSLRLFHFVSYLKNMKINAAHSLNQVVIEDLALDSTMVS